MAKQSHDCHGLAVMEGADYEGADYKWAQGTFWGDRNILSLDFIAGDVTTCTCQNAVNSLH